MSYFTINLGYKIRHDLVSNLIFKKDNLSKIRLNYWILLKSSG